MKNAVGILAAGLTLRIGRSSELAALLSLRSGSSLAMPLTIALPLCTPDGEHRIRLGRSATGRGAREKAAQLLGLPHRPKLIGEDGAVLGNATRLLDLVQGLAIADLLGSPATIEFELPLLHVVVVEKRCAYCGRVAHKKCGRCRMLRYCSAECQRVAWPLHRQMCEKLPADVREVAGR